VSSMYTSSASVPGVQFRAVPASLMAFSGHKTMKYTLEVGSTIFTNLGRDRGLDSYGNLKGKKQII